MRSGLALLAAVLLLGACTPSTPPEAAPSPTGRSAPASQPRPPSAAVTFGTDGLEDAGWVRNEGLSDETRQQYQDTRCVLQLIVLPESGPRDDAGDTDLALAALGEGFGVPETRPDVALPVGDGGTLAMRARRAEVDTGEQAIAFQVAVRAVEGVTVAVTHACYDHEVTDEEFEAVLELLTLTGVPPSGL